MDLNADGHLDILSGSYSRHDPDMAGLFQVLWGRADGTFQRAETLCGNDGQPLILPAGAGDDAVVDKICTRPFACDLDGDGKLDIVSGNFRGTFAWFRGLGDGKFLPQAHWLEADGKPMSVGHHGDPFLIDWDGDGDLDLISGSGRGGVFLFPNVGDRHQARFAASTTLLEPAGHAVADDDQPVFGDRHLKAPASSTRVWVADVDGNGKLDLLVGDQITVRHLADDVDEATARREWTAWQKRQQELLEAYPQDGDQQAAKQWQDRYRQLDEDKAKFLREETTGFVWLLRQR